MKNFRKMCRGQKGFTLIELLVVIIILGVLAAVVTLAVTRFIGKGVLESANAELVTVQAAVEACLAEGSSASFDGTANYLWTGTQATSPVITVAGDANSPYYASDQLRVTTLKATYTVTPGGDVILGNPAGGSAGTPWGATKIAWDAGTMRWIKYVAPAP